ncbi:MAG TPA: hypothetical protein VNM48_22470 [Chloroflexota bacterium]|nr:hypothetical protein [Chloroflexota bacterium]
MKPTKPRRSSALELLLDGHLLLMGVPAAVKEHVFAPPRRYRFDRCWPEQRLAVEVEGGVWLAQTGHTSGQGITANCEKSALAAVKGWRLMRVTGNQIKSGEAAQWIRAALGTGETE